MNLKLKIFLICTLLFFLILIIKKLKFKKISIRYATYSLITLLILFLSICFPNIYIRFAHFCGFETASNMIFLLAFCLLFYLIFMLLNTISDLKEKVKNLIQEVSILKKEKDE